MPACTGCPRQAHEIIRGALVRYSSPRGGGGSSAASATAHPPTAVLVHGILGCRRNMQSFAKRLVEGFPHWQVGAGSRHHGEHGCSSAAVAGPATWSIATVPSPIGSHM